jgi:hypothetical protein
MAKPDGLPRKGVWISLDLHETKRKCRHPFISAIHARGEITRRKIVARGSVATFPRQKKISSNGATLLENIYIITSFII